MYTKPKRSWVSIQVHSGAALYQLADAVWGDMESITETPTWGGHTRRQDRGQIPTSVTQLIVSIWVWRTSITECRCIMSGGWNSIRGMTSVCKSFLWSQITMSVLNVVVTWSDIHITLWPDRHIGGRRGQLSSYRWGSWGALSFNICVKPLDIFKATSGHFPAAFVETSTFVGCNNFLIPSLFV